MKYAICLRGISYRESHQHNNGIPPFHIDFNDNIENFKHYFINALKEKGHDVDLYFSTYSSIHLVDYYVALQPKRIKIRTFVDVPVGTVSSVYNGVLDSLQMLIDSNIHYDYIIITRFDILWLIDMSTLFLAPNAISIPSPGDDNFIALSGDLLSDLYYHYQWLRSSNMLNHKYSITFFEKGHRVHLVYKVEPKRLFFILTRDIYTDKTHPYYICDYKDLFNEQHPRYIRPAEPNKEYVPLC